MARQQGWGNESTSAYPMAQKNDVEILCQPFAITRLEHFNLLLQDVDNFSRAVTDYFNFNDPPYTRAGLALALGTSSSWLTKILKNPPDDLSLEIIHFIELALTYIEDYLTRAALKGATHPGFTKYLLSTYASVQPSQTVKSVIVEFNDTLDSDEDDDLVTIQA